MRGSEDHPAAMEQTLEELAELADRLRRFRAGDRGTDPPGGTQLAVAGRLVAHLGREQGRTNVTVLGETAVNLARAAGEAPRAVDERLLRLLASLADLLEDLLEAVDGGVDPADFLAGRDWSRYLPEHAGQRPPGAEPAAAGPVLLLVASAFRRAVLEDRFAAAGIPCETAADPAAALGRLERTPRPRGVVCDDQEPERNLGRLRSQPFAGGRLPPLVLLAAGGFPCQATTENLAARRGADHLWYEPFDPADLPF